MSDLHKITHSHLDDKDDHNPHDHPEEHEHQHGHHKHSHKHHHSHHTGEHHEHHDHGRRGHSHSHDHSVQLTSVNTSFIIGILLNFTFVVVEVIMGLSIHSLSLLSDAGHNLADVGSLALSLLAFKLMKVKANSKYTYGYRKTSILVALFNAMVLLVSVGGIVYEALHRFMHPEILQGDVIAWVAGIGIIINGLTAMMFFRRKDSDLNLKGAYLHMLGDALVSMGLVVGGIIIYYFHLYWLDPVLSIIIAVVILISTWNLLSSSLRLSLDGVPKDIDIENIKTSLMRIEGIKDIYHIHIWAISTTENALTAHVLFPDGTSLEQESIIKHNIKHKLQHSNIQHITLESDRSKRTDPTHLCED